jgi:hypothetical protein
MQLHFSLGKKYNEKNLKMINRDAKFQNHVSLYMLYQGVSIPTSFSSIKGSRFLQVSALSRAQFTQVFDLARTWYTQVLDRVSLVTIQFNSIYFTHVCATLTPRLISVVGIETP